MLATITPVEDKSNLPTGEIMTAIPPNSLFQCLENNRIVFDVIPNEVTVWGKTVKARGIAAIQYLSKPIIINTSRYRKVAWLCDLCSRDAGMCSCQYDAACLLYGKYVKPKIYIAPPCAGKSTFARDNKSIVDGDTLFCFPSGRWWKTDNNEAVLQEWGCAISNYVKNNSTPVTVALDPKYIDPELYSSIVFVLPTRWMRNIADRVRNGGNSWVKEDGDSVIGVWAEIFSRYSDIPIISSFLLVFTPDSTFHARISLMDQQNYLY